MSTPRMVLAVVAGVAVAAGLALLLRPGHAPAPPAVSAPASPRPVDADASDAPPSLYDLDLEHLTDHEGRSIELDVHRGHPTVVSMFYASCPSACPALMLEMKDMDDALEPPARASVRYLLVSFDPERDDTALLADVRKRYGLDDRWTLARTDEREVRVLATALGLRYRFMPDGEIDHSTNLALVRPDGGLDVRVDGLAQDKAEMARRIGELARPRS